MKATLFVSESICVAIVCIQRFKWALLNNHGGGDGGGGDFLAATRDIWNLASRDTLLGPIRQKISQNTLGKVYYHLIRVNLNFHGQLNWLSSIECHVSGDL